MNAEELIKRIMALPKEKSLTQNWVFTKTGKAIYKPIIKDKIDLNLVLEIINELK